MKKKTSCLRVIVSR